MGRANNTSQQRKKSLWMRIVRAMLIGCACAMVFGVRYYKKHKSVSNKHKLADKIQMSLPGPSHMTMPTQSMEMTDGSTDGENRMVGQLIHASKHSYNTSDTFDGDRSSGSGWQGVGGLLPPVAMKKMGKQLRSTSCDDEDVGMPPPNPM